MNDITNDSPSVVEPKPLKHKHKRRPRNSEPQQVPPPSSPEHTLVNLTASVYSPASQPPLTDHGRRSLDDDEGAPPIIHNRTSLAGVPRRHKQRVTYDPTLDTDAVRSDIHTGTHVGGMQPQYDEDDEDHHRGQPIQINKPGAIIGGLPIANAGPTGTVIIRGMGGSDNEDDRAASSPRARGAVEDGKPQQHDDFLEKLRQSMVRRGIANEHSAAVTNRNQGSQLTLDEIRRGLGAFGKHGGPLETHHSPSKVGRHSSGDNPTLSEHEDDGIDEFEPLDGAELEQCKARMQALSQLCEEVLVYCSLLDSSRLRAVEEGTRLQKSLRLLEALIEAAPQREILYQVERLRHINTKLDQRYRGLKIKAKQLIKECQESRDRLEAEYQKSNASHQTLDSELRSLQTTVANQRKELERAREANLNLKSPRDVADLDLKLKALEKDNDELRFQKSQVEEEYEKLTQALASQVQSSNLSQMGPSADSVKLKGEISHLEARLNSNLEELRAQNVDHSKRLASIRQDVDNYATYGKRLLNMVDNVSENKENS